MLQQEHQDKLPTAFTQIKSMGSEYKEDASDRWRIPKLQRTSCSKSPAQGARRWCCLTFPSTAPVNHLCFKDGFLRKLRVLYVTQSPQINWLPSTLLASSNWQNNQFFCIITEWSKAGSYQTIPALQLLSRLTATGNNSYILHCAAEFQIGQDLKLPPETDFFLTMRTSVKY